MPNRSPDLANAVFDQRVSVLGDTANSKVSDGTGSIDSIIVVIGGLVRPMSVEFEDTEHDTKEGDSDLCRVFPAHEAQKFQAIEADLRVNHPPQSADRAAVDSVNHTVMIPVANFARTALPEPVTSKPPVETAPEQSN